MRSLVTDFVEAMRESASRPLSSVLLEGLGNMAEVLGQRFLLLFPRVLYALVAMVGHPDAAVSCDAAVTLERVAFATGFPTVLALIAGNMDYLVDALEHRLRFVESYPEAPGLLLGILKRLSRPAMRPLIVELIEGVLGAVDRQYPEHRVIFLNVLEQVLFVLQDKVETSATPPLQPASDEADGLAWFERLERDYASGHYAPPPAFDGNAPQSEEEAQSADGAEPRDERLARVEVEVAREILMRTQHFIAGSALEQRVAGLHVLAAAVTVMAPWGTELRPAMHKVWAPFVARLRSRDGGPSQPTLSCVYLRY